MKVNKTNIFNEVKDDYRSQNVLDENVLNAFSIVDRGDFVPEDFRDFPYSDIEIPLANHQTMLRPSVEGMIVQSLNLRKSDNVLVVGSGTGYLLSCISLLCNKVDGIDALQDMIDLSQSNIKKHNFLNVKMEKKNIFNNLNILGNYNVVVFTFGLDNCNMIHEHLKEHCNCLMFENIKNFPMKSMIMINKLNKSNFTKNFITQAYTTVAIEC